MLLVGRPGKFSAGFDLSVMTAGDEPCAALVARRGRAGPAASSPSRCRWWRLHRPRPGHGGDHAAGLRRAGRRRRARSSRPQRGGHRHGPARTSPSSWPATGCRPRSSTPPCSAGSSIPSAAVAAGYLDRTVPADDLLASALAEATELSALSKGAVAHSKRLARQGLADVIEGRLAADMAATSGPRVGGPERFG